MARIELDNVSLTFRVRQHGQITLKDFLVRQMFRKSVNPVMEVKALQDVSLRLREGDRLGILGHNGAGKSTLLKLLAGIYPPTHGRRLVEGQISSLFEIGLGFEPDATGWENIAYRGFLQGETPASIRAKMASIAEFSELGDFLNMPVRYYSAGMQVRLAFSIATAIEPEILLVDEVLAVGDLAFQTKARQRMREMMAKARLLVLISHDLEYLSKICEQGIWMDRGRIMRAGEIREVIGAYTANVRGSLQAAAAVSQSETPGDADSTASSRPSAEAATPRRATNCCRIVAAGDGSQTASWQLNGLPAGWYEVQVTWEPSPGAAGNVPYTVYDGSNRLGTVRFHQQLDPFGTTVNGKVYQSLGTFRVNSGRLRVVLSNQAQCGEVIAEAIRVAAVPVEGPLVRDSTEAVFEEGERGWTTRWGLGGWGNCYRYTEGGTGKETATWEVTGLAPDDYEVQASWTPYPNRATNAPYQIYDDEQLLATVCVNQQAAAIGTEVRGVIFQSLGKFCIQSGRLRVVLSNDADNYVIADAIHVVPRPGWEPVIIAAGQTGYEECGSRWAA
jgi:ABC-type polysaccharide/polyol phosphate transport system ATPase subunit